MKLILIIRLGTLQRLEQMFGVDIGSFYPVSFKYKCTHNGHQKSTLPFLLPLCALISYSSGAPAPYSPSVTLGDVTLNSGFHGGKGNHYHNGFQGGGFGGLNHSGGFQSAFQNNGGIQPSSNPTFGGIQNNGHPSGFNPGFKGNSHNISPGFNRRNSGNSYSRGNQNRYSLGGITQGGFNPGFGGGCTMSFCKGFQQDVMNFVRFSFTNPQEAMRMAQGRK